MMKVVTALPLADRWSSHATSWTWMETCCAWTQKQSGDGVAEALFCDLVFVGLLPDEPGRSRLTPHVAM